MVTRQGGQWQAAGSCVVGNHMGLGFVTAPDARSLDLPARATQAAPVTQSEPDRLFAAIQAAQRLVAECDVLGEEIAGNYVALALDLLRGSPRLDAASAFRETGAHAGDAERTQPDV